MTRSIWSFAAAGALHFGDGASRRLPEILAAEGRKKILIVSDATLYELGVVNRIEALLGDFDAEVYVFSKPEPPIETAVRAAVPAQERRVDAIVGLGGGSAMDLAKCVALLAAHGGEPRDWFGFGRVPGPIVPLYCLPTTAGTGSEVSHSAVLTDDAAAMKVSTLSPWLRPRAAIVDPELTHGCPPRVTAETGLDALTHAVEAFVVRGFADLDGSRESSRAYQGKGPLTDALAREAIGRIFQWLPRAVEHGRDAEARRETALAASLAGMAFSNAGVSLVHALEYPLGGAGLCSHGLGNGLLLPHVVAALAPSRQPELAELGRLIGVADPRIPPDEAAAAFVESLFSLQRSVGIPTRLREIGAREEDLAEYARKAAAIERLVELAPCVATADALESMLRAAY